ncbi:hypothetical protein OH76DRAFT_1480755 [Lentinus brumalis]|uniref:Uncharacterized protein n=1 Tax=Lentinus brumalis TaxID=2498619 RepID=A0A371DHW3_9APHY|nr:hypothetical protein OH76DRAFT_1480755 [Polyporus brumalis]
MSEDDSIREPDLGRSSPVPPVEEEPSDDEDEATSSWGRASKGTGAKSLPEVDPTIVEYICGRFRARVARARQLSATPPPYGVAYRDVLRLRIIGSALAELGIGTGQGQRRYIRVVIGGRRVEVTPDHVMITLGMHPATYRSVRSRMDKVQSVYTWLGQNKHLWQDDLQRPVGPKLEHRAYEAMKALFGPNPLPTRQHIPPEPLPAGTHDALWEPCKTFLRWAGDVAALYHLQRGENLPVSPEFYDIE